MKRYSALAILIFFAACNGGDKQADHDETLTVAPTPLIKYNIMSVYPHDTGAYTQGLEFYKGKLYEGTGDYKNSSLRITDYKTGKVEKKHMMGSDTVFGEGITILKNKIYQLTWRSHIVYVYDIKNIEKPVATFKWPYEGWGLTNNGTDLIVSTGTANLYFVNPDDFKVKSTISVTDNSGNVNYLNELEYIDGFVYANVYESEHIVKIDPVSGHVLGKMDLTGIIQKFAPNYIPEPMDEVLNGIAYDSATKKILVTGKRWPKMFELRLN
jgi:glutaminyl-peptide cyclotransferase